MSTTSDSSGVETYPAPVLPFLKTTDDKWQREHRAFLTMLPELLKTHHGKVVAIHDGKLVSEGDDVVDVALRAYQEHGYLPMYVGPVIARPTLERLPIRRPVNLG
jgi:hypothetical protein